MKYVTIVDFGEYSVVEPIMDEYDVRDREVERINREIERIQRMREREETLSAYLAAFLSLFLPMIFVLIWIFFGY